jgi:spermidine/putrescine transport system substrate-binding protein
MKMYFSFSLLLLNLIINPIYAEDKILNVYTWAGYLPETTIQQFEKQTGIRIHHSTYLSNEVLYAKLKADPDARYDIIMPSTYFINRMVQQQLIQPIDKSKLTNLKNINPAFLNREYDPHNEYSLPYLYNTTGIAINKKYHHEFKNASLVSWKILWDPKYKDQLLVFDDTRETFAMALMKLGYSINDTNPDHIKEAFEQLKLLMDNIKLFNTEAQRSIYLDEDITIGMGWNGDLFLAKQENPALTLIYPQDGFLIALDCLAIPKGAKHIKYAHQFIDFLLQASVAKDIALLSGFSTSNLAGMHLLPENIRLDTFLYPDHSTMKRSQILNDIGDAALIYEKYFELLKL